MSWWCLEPDSNRYARSGAADFKSAVSTCFTIEADDRLWQDAGPKKNSPGNDALAGLKLEARAGVEPTYTDLQSGA